MNKTQFCTLSGALLASTALSGAANAGTIGKYTSSNFSTTALAIDNTVFSTTASTANAVVIGAGGTDRDIGMQYTNNFSGLTGFTTEFTISGARFITSGITLASIELLVASNGNLGSVANSVSASTVCASVTSLVDLLVVNDCSMSALLGDANTTGVGTGYRVHGMVMTGVTFNTASGLATAGTSVSLTGRVYNPDNTSQIFEASSTGNILTATVPLQVRVVAGTGVTASATTTPTAFVNLSLPTNGSLSLVLATIIVSATGALGATLAAASASAANLAGTTSITVSSSIMTSASVRKVNLDATSGSVSLSVNTAANFSSGTVTFSLDNTVWTGGNSADVKVIFQGTTSIPAAAAGTVTGSVVYNGYLQAVTLTGVTATVAQGGFRAEVNTFNASTNGPFSSYLRIHNNGLVAGTVTITVYNDDYYSGAALGSSFTTASILPGATLQLSAAEMEGTATSAKVPAGGANIPTASRTGSYTLSVTGPIVGYVQHILFDGNSVADLSGYRNSGSTSNQP